MNQFAIILASLQDILTTPEGADETVSIATSSWKDGLQVVVRRTREGKVVAYVPNSEIENVLTIEQMDLLSDAGIFEDGCDTRRISVGGSSAVCVGLNYDKLRKKAREAEREVSRVTGLERKVKDLEKELKVVRQDNSGEEAFAKVLDTLSTVLATRPQPKIVVSRPSRTAKKGRTLGGVPVLMLSDWHWGEVVDPAQVEYLNQYNVDIAKKRGKRVFDSTIDLLTNHMGGAHYESIVCALGGDMVSGNIHEELQRTNELGIVDAILTLHDALYEGIRSLAEVFGSVYVPCVVGNHGRLDKKPTMKNKVVDNYDQLLYKMLSRTFAADKSVKVRFDISESADLRFDVYGTRYLLTHGDQIKGSSGPAGLWPSMIETDARKRKRHQQAGGGYDYLLCGHFHRYGTVDGVIVNGSLKGYDEFGYTLNFDNEPATQALWITHPKFGITSHVPVYGETPKEPEVCYPPISGYSKKLELA